MLGSIPSPSGHGYYMEDQIGAGREPRGRPRAHLRRPTPRWVVFPPRAGRAMQAHASPGELAAELEAGTDFHFVVYQALGIVGEDLGISTGAALARLRACAFAHDRLLTEVVARRLRLDDQRPGAEPRQ